jgi:hypothetical protein
MITFEACGRRYKVWWRYGIHPERGTHEITDCFIAPWESATGKWGEWSYRGRVTRDSRDPDSKEEARKASLTKALRYLEKRDRKKAWEAYFGR